MDTIVVAGVEGSGKTVLMATLADKYKRKNANGFFLSPQNQQTMAFSNTLTGTLRQGTWPAATPADTAESYQWALMKSAGNAQAKKIRDIEYLDYGGEIYRAAFGMEHKNVPQDIVDSLKDKIRNASWLAILVNLSDLIDGSPSDRRYNETSWIPKGILDYVSNGNRHPIRRDHIAIILTQADSYANTIKACGGPCGALERYLPHVASVYKNINVIAVSAVNKVVPDSNGIPVPAADFGSDGLDEMMSWLSRRVFPKWRICCLTCGAISVILFIVGVATPSSHYGEILAEAMIFGFFCAIFSLMEKVEKRGAKAEAEKALVEKVEKRGAKAEAELGGVQLWAGGPFWAECNVGATKPEEAGYYFWWGDTVGYKRNQSNNGWVSVKNGEKFSFKGDNCPTLGKDDSQLKSSGYLDSSGHLAAKYDAATAHCGAPWRMPTDAEFEALKEHCDTEWTKRNGIFGRLVRGRGDYSSQSIFFPAAGFGYDSYLYYLGSYGYYWSSTPNSDYSSYAWSLYFDSGGFGRDYYFGRYRGQSVRPVRGFAK